MNDDKGIRAGRELGRAGLSPKDVNRLENEGAAYPPDRAQDLEAAINRSPILKLLGITKLHSPEWHRRGEVSNDSEPVWLVRAEGQGVDLALTCFVLFVEPFDGRLTRISAIDPERMNPESPICVPPRSPW